MFHSFNVVTDLGRPKTILSQEVFQWGDGPRKGYGLSDMNKLKLILHMEVLQRMTMTRCRL